MAVEYARRGLVGTAPGIEARLVEYFDRLDDWVAAFANAPIQVLAVACTGAS